MCYSVESELHLLEVSEVSEVLDSAEGDTLCATLWRVGSVCWRRRRCRRCRRCWRVPKVIRCVLLCILEAVEDRLCLLEVLGVWM